MRMMIGNRQIFDAVTKIGFGIQQTRSRATIAKATRCLWADLHEAVIATTKRMRIIAALNAHNRIGECKRHAISTRMGRNHLTIAGDLAAADLAAGPHQLPDAMPT